MTSKNFQSVISPDAEAGEAVHLMDTIELKQDVGTYEPKYKRVTVELMSDGTMHWTAVTVDVGF